MMIRILSFLLIVGLMLSNIACSTSNSIERKRRLYLSAIDQGTLIHKITISGFILSDKKKLDRIILPYQKKRLTRDKIDQMLQEIADAYNEAGFTGLVTIRYELHKSKLKIAVDLK